MLKAFQTYSARITMACALLLSGGLTQAHLGGSEASVQADAVAWQASTSAARGTRFAVFTVTTSEGVKVRQFVSASGLVFAVAWDGPVLPDMEILLGSHFAPYQAALQQRTRHVRVDTPMLALESGGMMRAFVGRAYLPDQLPVGVTAADIQ